MAVIPVLDENILKVYEEMTETIKRIVRVKEEKYRTTIDWISTQEPIVESKYIITWEYSIIRYLRHNIPLELKISVECFRDDSYRYDKDTYYIYIYASTFDKKKFFEVIEIFADEIANNDNNYLVRFEKFIRKALDCFIERINKIVAELVEAEKEITNKIVNMLENKLGLVIGFNLEFKSYKNVENDKLVEGYINFFTTQYRVTIKFTYYINTKKFIIDNIIIDAQSNNEDVLLSLLLQDVAKDLFDSS